ncbi:MAG: cupin domain-containing protein [Betaproteobacteria bacterium]|nr:cupin domain-containing protein [Betaproteobacteria bacterium]
MAGFVRRVVTGHDRNGKAIVISDGLAPTVKTNPLLPGHRSTDIWKTHAAPVPIFATEVDPTPGPRTLHPPPQGTVIRIAEIAPESEKIRNLTPEQAREFFKASRNEAASTYERGGRHPMMHRTETIDYAVVLDGEITLLLDDEDVQLKTGDVVIQRGTNHAWSNRSGKPVRMLYILIDGRFAPELAALFKAGSGH